MAHLLQEEAIQIIKAGFIPADRNFYFSICGYSMSPMLYPGAKVMVSPQVEPKRIFIGDIVVITYPHCSNAVAHRVIFVRKRNGESFFLTKGDGNRSFDQFVGSDQILGKVVAIQKENRLINLSQTSWRVAGIFIAAISGICGLLHRLIGRYSIFCGRVGSKVGLCFGRIFFLIYRIFLRAVVVSLS